MKLFFLLCILLTCLSSWAQTSYIGPTKILIKKGYQLGVQADTFNSSERVDKNGHKLDFKSGDSFLRMQSEVSGFYGLTNTLQIGGGTRFRQNSSRSLNETTNKIDSESATGIESTSLNFIYAFQPVNKFHYSLDGQYRYRTFSNEESIGPGPTSLILGDDGNDYLIGAGVSYYSEKNNFLTARFGYRDPGKHLSEELYWQIEGALVWRYLALVAGVDGVSSLSNDPYGNNLLEKPIFNTGSTYLYHTSNREIVSPYVGMNLALGDSWRIELKGSQVISGRSTDLGTALGVSLFKRVEEQKSSFPDKSFKEYDFEASITKLSPKKGFVVIDKGISDDVQKGMKIDFFESDYIGGNLLLGRGIVVESKSGSSVVKITQIFNTKKDFSEGVIARGSFK